MSDHNLTAETQSAAMVLKFGNLPKPSNIYSLSLLAFPNFTLFLDISFFQWIFFARYIFFILNQNIVVVVFFVSIIFQEVKRHSAQIL